MGRTLLSVVIFFFGCSGARTGAERDGAQRPPPSVAQSVAPPAPEPPPHAVSAAASAPVAVEAPGTPHASPVDASVAAAPVAPGPCGPFDLAPSDAVLWAAIPATERVDLDALPRRVVMAELDGAPPSEAVLLVERIPEPDTFSETGESTLWVLARRAGGWVSTGRRQWSIEEGSGGTFDGEPGVQVFRPEELRATCGQFLRVEHLNLRGSADPRFSIRHFELLHVHEGALVVAFQCDTQEDHVSGPDRSGTTTVRTVVYQRAAPLSIRVREVTTDDDTGRRRTARTTYVLDGARFEAPNDVCGSSSSH